MICVNHYNDVIMGTMESQITSLTIVYSTVYSGGVDQRKHQSSASLAFVREIQQGPVNSPYKWPVTRKMFPFDDVILQFHDGSASVMRNSHLISNTKHATKRRNIVSNRENRLPQKLFWRSRMFNETRR